MENIPFFLRVLYIPGGDRRMPSWEILSKNTFEGGWSQIQFIQIYAVTQANVEFLFQQGNVGDSRDVWTSNEPGSASLHVSIVFLILFVLPAFINTRFLFMKGTSYNDSNCLY